MTSLRELFPDGDYRFHLTLRRGEPRGFFCARDARGLMLAERARWLAEQPERYAALAPAGAPLVDEFSSLCTGWNLIEPVSVPTSDGNRARSQLLSLGHSLEPDVLFLSPDNAGRFVLRGGVLCFPTGWALEEKIGHPLDFIHGVVPGLNAALGSQIQLFLGKLKPGVAYLRDNWGITASDELNAHPARQLPVPTPPVALDRLWLRVEYQALTALPLTGGVAFGIRIALHRLDRVVQDSVVAEGLRRAIASMPAALAAYKRLDTIRDELVRRLQAF